MTAETAAAQAMPDIPVAAVQEHSPTVQLAITARVTVTLNAELVTAQAESKTDLRL